jgi:hypothetical protein
MQRAKEKLMSRFNNKVCQTRVSKHTTAKDRKKNVLGLQ